MQNLLAQNLLGPLAATLSALACVCSGDVRAAAASARVTRCELFTHGMTIGHGNITRTHATRDGRPCTEIRLRMDTRVNMLVYKFTMTMDETWVMSGNELIAYTWDSTENGKRKTVSGELRDGVFSFAINENGKARTWSAPRAAYDLTAIGQPDKPLAPGETRTLRVLDPCECTVGERLYRGSGDETLKIGERAVACATVTIDYAGDHLRRWVAADEFGPLILREDGELKRGSYSRCASVLNAE